MDSTADPVSGRLWRVAFDPSVTTLGPRRPATPVWLRTAGWRGRRSTCPDRAEGARGVSDPDRVIERGEVRDVEKLSRTEDWPRSFWLGSWEARLVREVVLPERESKL